MDLRSLFGAKSPAGSGMVQQAAQILQSQPYRAHMAEAQALGQQPMSPEAFMQMMAQQRPKGLLDQ